MKYDLEKFREALAVVISMGEPEEPPEDCSNEADEAYGKVLDEWQAFALGLDDATMHLIGDFHYDADTGAIAALKSIALLRFGEANDARFTRMRALGKAAEQFGLRVSKPRKPSEVNTADMSGDARELYEEANALGLVLVAARVEKAP
jgi:hypothetical protein